MSKDRPILFSGAMVRALIARRKRQTRRVCLARTQNQATIIGAALQDDMLGADDGKHELAAWQGFPCPYGIPGDRLWVRETFAPNAVGAAIANVLKAKPQPRFYYQASHEGAVAWRWRPSIHMPRVASRLTLSVAKARVERLQDISEADAIAEGIEYFQRGSEPRVYRDYSKPDVHYGLSPIGSYRTLWESINGPGSWDANPFVWVIEFETEGARA